MHRLPFADSSQRGLAQEVAGDSIYDFTVKDIGGQDVSLNEYNGKVVLIVNVASKWGQGSNGFNTGKIW